MKIFLLFPHQLYEQVEVLKTCDQIYLIEEYLYFKQYSFHQQKIQLHRASMKYYESYLLSKGFSVTYIEAQSEFSDIRNLSKLLVQDDIEMIDFYDPTDNWLLKRLQNSVQHLGIKMVIHESPNFFNSSLDVKNYFLNRKKILHHDFYVAQRKKWNILVDEKQQPVGGKWSFDEENRKKYPNQKTPPSISFPAVNPFMLEARTYVEKYFYLHLGKLNPFFTYPCTHEEARQWLQNFIAERLLEFGWYEDAIVKEEVILHHSLLSPLLNIGLLQPQEVVSAIIEAINQDQIPLNSGEGIIRQLIGWREYVRGVYIHAGTKMRNGNFWHFDKDLPNDFYTGTTDIEPIDASIQKVINTAYCHHIERLMILGNFMLLNKIHPEKTYVWFMEFFIDAYDWVMVPNIYGMSQFADGGYFTTKPYISSSNYVLKMSNYKSKEEWTNIWDALYWNFINEHRTYFASNPRLQFSLNIYDKFSEDKKLAFNKIADSYFQRSVSIK